MALLVALGVGNYLVLHEKNSIGDMVLINVTAKCDDYEILISIINGFSSGLWFLYLGSPLD